VAVFPDKIILKNSTDSQASIETAIGSGGSDEIVYGELVIGREQGAVKIYALDAVGDIKIIGFSGDSTIDGGNFETGVATGDSATIDGGVVT
jgi:hypothetical protein